MQDVLAGRYLLGEELGRGGMARVVRARDLRLHRAVAVKLLDAGGRSMTEPSVRGRFVREARAAASFTHPHVVSIFDAGDADGALYLVMELVDGPSLATLLARDGPFGIERSRELVDQVLQALGAAHQAGIVHRDVKPANVLVTADGTAKLSDFGIAKRLDDLGGDLTAPGDVVGTPSSMAPEQVMGQPATAATDIYAAGVLLFQLLVAGPPFVAGSSLATALAHRDAPVPDVRERRPDVPAALAAVIRTAMAKDPTDRFASADEMRAALTTPHPDRDPSVGPASSDADDRTSVATMVLPSARPAASAATWWWWVALGVVVVAAAAVVVLGRIDDPPDRSAPTSESAAATAPVAAPTTTVSISTVPTAPVPTAPPATPPRTVAPAPNPTVAPSTVDEVIGLIEDDPDRFGPHAAELQRDLERIQQRTGRQLERDVQRLSGRLADWSADGTIDAEVAALVDAVLADVVTADDDDE